MPPRLPVIVFALVMAAIPFIPGMPPFWIVILDNIGLAALVAMGLVLLTGVGGLVSYPLTAVAALVVGIVEAFSSFYASDFKEVIVFTLILPVLVLRSLAQPAVEEEKD